MFYFSSVTVVNNSILFVCVFVGCDGTRAFVTGEFNEKGLIDDTSGFDYRQMLELLHWIEFYDKTYQFVGKFLRSFCRSALKVKPFYSSSIKYELLKLFVKAISCITLKTTEN